MTEALPVVIEHYFAGKNDGDFSKAISGFASTAVVKDEGHRHEGLAAIRAWMEETTARYDDKAAVKSFARVGCEVTVLAEVSGTFPGSPIPFRFTFTLKDDQILRLEIDL